MNIGISLPALILIATCAAAPSTASAQRPDPSAGGTPNSCIERNAGDWNACNVGNGGRGDLPYRPTGGTPNSCIERNAGDWNACNIGNGRRGDLPYLR